MKLTFPDGHTEELTIYEYPSSLQPVILAFPWLQQHNPQLKWCTGEVLFWSDNCKQNCFPHFSFSLSHNRNCFYTSCSETPDITGLSECYHDLKEIFSKSPATSLPLHRLHDHATDQLPGTSPPKGSLYSVTTPESTAMRECIQSSLAAGIIHPSSSSRCQLLLCE